MNGPGDLTAGCPVTPPAGTVIVDRGGWGTAACPEGAPAPAFVSGESIVRAPNDADGSGGDSNDNAADFSVALSFTPRTSLDVAGCASQGATRPREVSSAASREPLLVTRVGASLALSFQEMTEASGYHVYAGSIGLWYSHGSSADTACDAPTSAGPSGRRVVTRPMPAASLYFVVSAWNAMGEGETGQRSDGARLPAAEATCAP